MRTVVVAMLLMLSVGIYAEGEADFGKAKWIGLVNDVNDEQSSRSIWLRRTIVCDKPLKRATLNICGLGFYELYVNGRKVGDEIMSTAWSDYKKTIFYNTTDITSEIEKNAPNGEIELSVLLGNSFYNEVGKRYHKLKTSYGPVTLLFHLDIEYRDGSRMVVNSDDKWKVKLSPVVYNSIYGGEDYDARMEDMPGMVNDENSNPWRNVVVQTAPKGKLRRQLCYPVKIIDTYPVKKRISSTIYDMGQNVAGFPKFTVSGKRGQSFKMKIGEQVVNGHVSQKQTGGLHTYTYTLRGDSASGSETYHPHFSYYGFRYIEVEGAVMKGDANPDSLPVIESLQSCMVSNSAPMTGSFECSNRLFNDAYRIIDRAIRSNWQSVWTDCPHREKLGWLEQDWLNGPGLVYNYDSRSMIEQTMINIVDAQHEDGSMPEIAPEYIKFEGSWAKPFQQSPEWGGAIVALPYLYKDFYGSDSLINVYMPQMKRYVEYLATQDSAYILKMGLGDWYDFGEGKAGFAKNTPMPLVSTAHYYRWAKTIGMEDLASKIKKAFIKEFKLESQAGIAIALELGLYPKGKKEKLLKALVDDIHAHGDRLTTGDVGTPYLFKVLLDNGERNLLYKMLNHYETPGYGYQIQEGMTTLAEQWDPKQGASRNHFMMAHINNHLIQNLVGIRIHGDDVLISPQIPDGITYAKGKSRSCKGDVSVEWRIDNGSFVLKIVAPEAGNVKIDANSVGKFCKSRKLKPSCCINGTIKDI